ncbi:MAG: DoxX family protein [Deltaproteobacteria bacterium]|nr:DoxX family protein [Deltaproteobacteria bacterium]
MQTSTISSLLQVILALGLLNVWLVRPRAETAYRGGAARSLEEEFVAYGLPGWAFFLVGALKLGIAVVLLVGLWIPSLVPPAAACLVLLMLGAVAMHLKVGDPPIKSLPALLMLALSGSLLSLTLA